MPVDRIQVKVTEVHKVLISEGDGQWIDILPGSFNFVYGSLVDGDGGYISDIGMFTFTTPDGNRFNLPSERLAGMVRPPEVIEPPIEPEDPPVDPELPEGG